MGVHYLWSILTAVGRQTALSSLTGKTLAVDLSGWVCQALNCRPMSASMQKPHLRNLFFRIHNMYRLGINLVFVVDGDATKMKWQTMDKRARSEHNPGMAARKTGRRSRLHVYVKECCEMLDLLGVPYLNSIGEAEAYCALLNSRGVVEGVLTDDTDALLYGAPTVYKSISVGAKNSSVVCYNMSDIERHFGMSRDSLIAMALLLGCDYLPDGVPGIGRETVIKLIKEKKGVNLLDRFSQWTSSEFDSSGLEPVESSVYKKAMAVHDFPNTAVIQEFKILKDKMPTSNVHWKKPDYHLLKQFICKQLIWEERYTREKILTLLTQWAIRQQQQLCQVVALECELRPLKVLKHRVRGGVPILEVEWNGISGEPDSKFTTEVTSQFKNAFPVLYAEYDEQVTATKKKIKPKQKKAGTILLDKKGLPGNASKQCLSHQPEQNSSSDTDDEVLPLFKRIQLQPKEPCSINKVDCNLTTTCDNPVHITCMYGTTECPIVID